MIAVWIVATAFTLVGFLWSFPRYYKIFTCSKETTGILIGAGRAPGTGDQPIKAQYEYYVDGEKYVASTGWTNYGSFHVGREYKVRYNPKNPKISLINKSGLYINCAIGTLFFLVGIAVYIIGLYLSVII